MMDFLISMCALLIAMTVLVGVHEFGHFITARCCGIKVLSFSFGFGKVLWRRIGRSGTEFSISLFPLGGYIKMLDEKEGPVATAELPYAFNRQSIAKRMAVVIAGPVFNFIFAIVLYWLINVIGVTAVVPLVGAVTPHSPAAIAGVKVNDIIKSVDSREMPNWQTIQLALLEHLGEAKIIQLQVQQRGQTKIRNVQLSLPAKSIKPELNLLAETGIIPYTPKLPPLIAKVLPDSPAHTAGLKSGDKVIRINSIPIRDWQQIVTTIKSEPKRNHAVVVQRNGHAVSVVVKARLIDQPEGTKVPMLGIQSQKMEWPPDLLHKQQYGPIAAWGPAFERFEAVTVLTFKVIGKLLTGHLAWSNVSGPIGIAQGAGQSVQHGLTTFLMFLALVSIGLGVLNLLPIPVLDGGHLLYYVIEIILRRPLSDNAQLVGMKVGVTLLILLMGVAFYNDILRLF